MKTRFITPMAIALLTFTAGCSDPAPSTGTEQRPEETTADGQEAEPEGSTDTGDDLIITVDSESVDFDPTDVYCKVGGGELRHLIAKTDNQPPLLEVTPGEFAMLKLQKQGAPEKNTNPTKIDYRTSGVVFDNATIGDATLNGSLECTEVAGE